MEELAVLGWLFRRPVMRDQAISIADQFLLASGRRLADDGASDVDGCYACVRVELPSRRWYVTYRLHPRSRIWHSHSEVQVWVHSITGVTEFPHP